MKQLAMDIGDVRQRNIFLLDTLYGIDTLLLWSLNLIPSRATVNLHKHKIDFKEAQDLWKDQYAAIVDARSDSEPRSALIAFHRGKMWSAFFTERSAKIRLISVRRARTEEEEIYYESRRTG